MSDMRTATAQLLAEMHKTQDSDEDFATIALCVAMDYHKSDPFWFNENTWLWTMTQGTFQYKKTVDPNTGNPPEQILSLPTDLLIPRNVQVQVGGTWWAPMDQTTMEDIRTGIFYEGNTGYPDRFAWFNESYYFYSIPQSDFPSRIDYIRDLPRPRYSFDGTSWIFEEPQEDNGATVWVPLTPTFTNRWLQDGETMIRAYAMWYLYQRYYKDTEAAQLAWQDYKHQMSQLNADKDRYEQGKMRLVPTTM